MWDWFLELSGCRQFSDAGPQRISYTELDAWSRVTGARPSRYELMLIHSLDRLFVQLINDGRRSAN